MNWTSEQLADYESRRNPKAAAPTVPAPSHADLTSEREMHALFGNWLRLHSYIFLESRMDKRSTIREGWPDFSIFRNGKTVFVEMKVKGNPLSDEQTFLMGRLTDAGVKYCIAYSVEEAIAWTSAAFGKNDL